MSDSLAVVMYGTSRCRDCRRSKALLDGLGVSYAYLDVDTIDGAAEAARAVSGRSSIPVLVFPNGSHQVVPSNVALRARLEELALL